MKALVALLAALALPATARASAPTLALAPCSVGGTSARCGTLIVPESRALPAGRTIGLNVAVLPATETPADPDPLFYIAGGPGGAATGDLAAVARLWPRINAHRDIVFVDQRGTGSSNPLVCTLAPTGFASVDEFVQACLLGLGGADVTQYRTPEAMDDLDAVRAALGYDQIDVYGVSYGATAAQVYLRRHPQAVRTVVLDGATLLDIPVLERWASNAQRSLSLIAKRCRAERQCARAFPRWYERFPALLAKLAKAPKTVAVAGTAIRVDAQTTADAVETMSANVYDAVQIPFVLAKAEAGNVSPLARAMLAQGQAGGASVMHAEIMCTEPWAEWDPLRAAANAKGTYLAYSWGAEAAQNAEICAALPKVDVTAEDWTRISSPAPVLVLAGGADPKDPPGNVAGLASSLPNSKLVVVPGQGHGVAFAGCVPQVVGAFLDRGSVAGLDTSCVSVIGTPSFRR